VVVEATGERTPYKNMDGKLGKNAKKNTPSNPQLVKYLKEKGRIVFGVNKQIKNTMNKIVRNFINAKIKKSIFQSRKG
jgi:glyceraldehyde-3-phosphate dehydrogenase/erythrose-4-phosphate dehydrogenase